jgi:VWFA-related protein
MLATAGIVLALPVLVASQEQVPVFPSTVDLVTVDAVVLDKAGRPVRGLKAEDFVIEEDGKPQEIASFEAIDLGDAAEAEPFRSSPVASNRRAGRVPGRAFVILVDDLGLAQASIPFVATTLTRFMDAAFSAGDEVTLGSTSGSIWWSVRWPEGREELQALAGKLRGGKLSQWSAEFMSDWEAYQIEQWSEGVGVPSGTSSGQPPAQTPTGLENTEGAPPVAGTNITGRVVKRWTDAHVCDPRNPGMCTQMVEMRARENNSLRRDRTRAIMAGVERAVFSLSGVRGRKELLLLSEGFLYDADLPVVRQVAGACREANLAVNFLDARGLVASIEEGTAAFSGGPPNPREVVLIEMERLRFESEGSVALAEDTGGVAVSGTNDLAGRARRIVDESRAYYLIGYRAPSGKVSRDWRKLKVEVKRPETRVRARKGYTLRPPGTTETLTLTASAKDAKRKESGSAAADAAGSDLSVSRALANAADVDGIPLRATAYVFDESKAGRARVLVAVEADLATVEFRGGGDKPRATLDVAIEATHRDTGLTSRSAQKVEISRPAAGSWSFFSRQFELAAGVSQARVVVKDEGSGRLGAVTVRLEVPALSGLRLSTPILTDQVRQGGRQEPLLVARRVFKPSGVLYCQFQVFGAANDSQGIARVDASYVLRQASGVELLRTEPKPIAAAAGRPVMKLIGFPLDGLAAGDYEIVLSVVDTTTGGAVERGEPFTIAASASRSAESGTARSVPAAGPSGAAAGSIEDKQGVGTPAATILERAARYVEEYEKAFSNLVAEESYRQWGTDAGTVARTLRSDLVFVRLTGPLPWGTFRDVYEVDGQKVHDRQQRLEKLFFAPKSSDYEQAQAILDESSRYNLGRADRNVNTPTLGLLFLSARNQSRLAFKRRGTRTIAGFPTVEIAFEERATPTLVHDRSGRDVPASGRFWIDETRGTVLRTEIEYDLEPDKGSRSPDTWERGSVSTEYRRETALGCFVPDTMKELYNFRGIGRIETSARYSNYRRFDVSVVEEAKK